MHTHSKISKLIWLVVIALLFWGGFWFYTSQKSVTPLEKKLDNIDIVSEEIPKGKVGMSMYENYLYNFNFQYPQNLYMKESDSENANKSSISLVMVEGTKDNISLLEGTYSGPTREGPTQITIDVYPNEKKLSAADWAKQDTNWKISNKETSYITVGGIQGVSYSWSGLYAGESIILTKGTETLVFSVTWITPEDQILKDFDTILKSFSFEI